MHMLITTGGTREYIDPVRFISNASSGRMGFALARAAVAAGHTVTLVAAPTDARPPRNPAIETINVTSARDMFLAVKANFPRCDCLIMAAAVADYTPARPSKRKLKKSPDDLTLDLKPTPDILKWASRNKSRQLLVGFALEDADLLARAEEKLKNKRADFIVANSTAAIATPASTVHIKSAAQPQNWITLKNTSKSAIAKKIIALITQH